VGPLWIASTLTQAATLAMRVVVAYRVLDLGYDATAVAVMAAGFSAVPGLFAIPFGQWTDRSGAKSKGVIGAAVVTASSVSLVTVHDLVAMGALVVVYGLGQLLCIVSQQSLIAQLVPDARLGLGFARYNLYCSIGQMVGPPLVTSIAGYAAAGVGMPDVDAGPAIVTALAVATMVSSALVRRPEARPRAAGVSAGLGQLWGQVRRPGTPVILATSFSSVAGTEVLLVFLPVWGEEHGVAKSVIGVLLAVRAGATIIGQGFVGPLLAHWTQARIVRGTLLVSGLGLAVLPWCGAIGALAPVTVIGLAFGITQPVTLAWIVSRTDPGRRGAVLGVRVTAQRIAQFAVPLAASPVAVATGVGAVFWLTALLLCGTTLLRLKD
jgi:MFS family permease